MGGQAGMGWEAGWKGGQAGRGGRLEGGAGWKGGQAGRGEGGANEHIIYFMYDVVM